MLRPSFGDVNFDAAWRQSRRRFDMMDLFIKGVIAVVALVVVGGIVLGSFVADVGGTDGRHTGYVTAVEDADNWVFDATIVYVKSNPASTQEDKYCVNDPKVRRELEQASANGTRVTIHYHNDFLMMKWECNGGSTVIVGVEPAGQAAGGGH